MKKVSEKMVNRRKYWQCPKCDTKYSRDKGTMRDCPNCGFKKFKKDRITTTEEVIIDEGEVQDV